MQFDATVEWNRGSQCFLDQRYSRGDERQLDALAHAAHEQCYIANSLKADVCVEAVVS